MRYIVKTSDGIVVNVIELADPSAWHPPVGAVVVKDDGRPAFIGLHHGEELIAEEQ